MNSIFHSTLYSVIETGLNQAVALDPGARKQIALLTGKCIRIDCQSPGLLMNILVCEDHLSLSGNEALHPDISIAGKASALIKLLLTRKTNSLKQDGVVISGDIGLLTKFQGILQNLDIDWEYQLSKFIGDIPTQAVSDSMASAGTFARKTQQNLEQDIDSYLHEEIKMFPAKQEIDNFYHAVDALRLRVDRLASRTNREFNRRSAPELPQ